MKGEPKLAFFCMTRHLHRRLGLLPALAVEPGAQGFLQGVQAVAAAGDLEVGVAFEGGDHQVAAEGHFAVDHPVVDALQANEQGAQGVEGPQIGVVVFHVEIARQHVGVFAQGDDGLAAEGFGLVAHLGQFAAFFGGQADQAGEVLFQGGDGTFDGDDVFVDEAQGDTVLGHVHSIDHIERTRRRSSPTAAA